MIGRIPKPDRLSRHNTVARKDTLASRQPRLRPTAGQDLGKPNEDHTLQEEHWRNKPWGSGVGAERVPQLEPGNIVEREKLCSACQLGKGWGATGVGTQGINLLSTFCLTACAQFAQ